MKLPSEIAEQMVKDKAINPEDKLYAEFVVTWLQGGKKAALKWRKGEADNIRFAAFSNLQEGGFIKHGKLLGDPEGIGLILWTMGARGYLRYHRPTKTTKVLEKKPE